MKIIFFFLTFIICSKVLAQKFEINYDSNNRISSVKYSNGIMINYFYDNNGNRQSHFITAAVVTNFVFTGNGNWNSAANWQNGNIPPNPLPSGSSILINPSGTAECILNVPQTINAGASLRVEPGKRFRVNGNLIIR